MAVSDGISPTTEELPDGRSDPLEPNTGSGADAFDPFYERFARWFPGVLMPRVSLPLALALAYYALHGLVIGTGAAAFYPELLALIIFVVPTLIYLATSMFHELSQQMDSRVGTDRAPVYRTRMKQLLGDRGFLLTAALLGLANPAAAMSLGLEMAGTGQYLVVLTGYSLAGAFCGLALWGVIGIVRTIRVYVREDQPRYDATAPDRCGGMLFMGRAISTFGMLALIGSVLISSYMLLAESQIHSDFGHDKERWETVLLWSFVALPYVLSLYVLIAPTFELHGGLHSYGVAEDRNIEDILTGLEAELEEAGADRNRLEALRFRRDEARERREMIYAMSTWPFSLDTHLKYVLVVALNGVLTFSSASSGRLGKFIAGLGP